jgi:hypothetical protein
METAKSYAGVTVEPHELLFPIPQQEIELSNYILIQTPGVLVVAVSLLINSN